MAAKIIGRLVQFGYAKEATRGTYVAATYWLPFMDLTLDEKQEKVFDEQAYGIIEDAVSASNTGVHIEGSVTANLYDQSFGLFLFSMMGTLTTHAAHSGETGVYDNVFNIAETSQHQSLSFSIHDPGAAVDYAYLNGVIEKLEINIELKKFVQFVATFKAMTGVVKSTFTPATTTENRFLPQYLTLSIANKLAGIETVFAATGTAATTTAVSALSIPTDRLKVGMVVVGTNIPAGTTVAAIVSATAFTLSQASTGNASDLTFSSLAGTGTASTTVNVTALSGTPAITTAQLQVGMTVTGPNIPAGATIAAIVSSTAFTLSIATTGVASTMSFGPMVVKVKSAKLSINQNVEAQDVLGSTSPADFLNKEFNVTFSIEAIWQNESDFKTDFMSNAANAFRLDMKNTDVTIGIAANPQLQIDMAQCYVTELSRPIKVKDLIYQTIKGRAVYSISDTSMLKATLVNTVNGF